jgi:hypothetical protein
LQACKVAFDDEAIDFVEALVYSTNEWVVMKGWMQDTVGSDGTVNKIGQCVIIPFILHEVHRT